MEQVNQASAQQSERQKAELLIVKIGGNVINDEKGLATFLKDFAGIGGRKMLVHGGGRKATEIGEKLGIVSRYVDGRRITDAETIDLVTMVYGGLLNKQIVAKLQALQCNALGLSGADANSIPAEKRPVGATDYGFVGDVSPGFPVTFIRGCLEEALVPVFAPLTHDGKGQLLNTNADTIASVLAVALARFYKVRLMYCFEKKGVLKDVEDEDAVVPYIDQTIYQQMLADKLLTEGILPKLHNAFEAIDQGVDSVLIGHAADVVHNAGTAVSGTLIRK